MCEVKLKGSAVQSNPKYPGVWAITDGINIGIISSKFSTREAETVNSYAALSYNAAITDGIVVDFHFLPDGDRLIVAVTKGGAVAEGASLSYAVLYQLKQDETGNLDCPFSFSTKNGLGKLMKYEFPRFGDVPQQMFGIATFNSCSGVSVVTSTLLAAVPKTQDNVIVLRAWLIVSTGLMHTQTLVLSLPNAKTQGDATCAESINTVGNLSALQASMQVETPGGRYFIITNRKSGTIACVALRTAGSPPGHLLSHIAYLDLQHPLFSGITNTQEIAQEHGDGAQYPQHHLVVSCQQTVIFSSNTAVQRFNIPLKWIFKPPRATTDETESLEIGESRILKTLQIGDAAVGGLPLGGNGGMDFSEKISDAEKKSTGPLDGPLETVVDIARNSSSEGTDEPGNVAPFSVSGAISVIDIFRGVSGTERSKETKETVDGVFHSIGTSVNVSSVEVEDDKERSKGKSILSMLSSLSASSSSSSSSSSMSATASILLSGSSSSSSPSPSSSSVLVANGTTLLTDTPTNRFDGLTGVIASASAVTQTSGALMNMLHKTSKTR